MRVHKIAKGSFEVTTDVGIVLGWIDLEQREAQDGPGTIEEHIAKPVVGAAKAARTLGEAAAYVASTCN